MQQILLQGYGFSGVSFLRDFFKEIDGTYVFDKEFDLFRKSGGIMDLITTLSLNNPFLDDCVIRRFSNFYNYLYDKENWKSVLGEKFLTISRNLEKDLILLQKDWFERGFAVQENLKFPKDRLHLHRKYKENVRILNNDKDIYFLKNRTQEEYKQLLKKYLSDVLNLFPECEYLVLVHPLQISSHLLPQLYFFDNFKIITISRDPRDVYVNSNHNDNIDFYINNFKKWRMYDEINYKECKDFMLNIKFEDFVLNYDNVEKQILDFCNIDISKHRLRKTLSNPEVSRSNVGLHAGGGVNLNADIIYKELQQYCYD